MNLVTSHFRRLTDFAGRENREPFWLWVLVLFAGQIVIGVAAQIPFQLSIRSMVPMQPGSVPPQDPAKMFDQIGSLFGLIIAVNFVMGLAFLVLVSAAMVRRLHDSDRSGYWGLPPILFGLAAQGYMAWVFVQMAAVFKHPEGMHAEVFRDMMWFVLIWLGGFISSVVLLILLVLPGTDGTNRFGEDPLADYRAWLRERALNPEAPPRPARVVRGEEG